MKKYLLAFVWFVFFVYPNAGLGTGFSTTHALSLKGVVTDAVSSKNLKDVKITLSTNPAKSATTKVNGKFKIKDFIPPESGQSVDISFEKEGYIKQVGEIYIDKQKLYYDAQFISGLKLRINPQTHLSEIDPTATYTLPDIRLYPKPKMLISGTVYYETDDGDAVPIDGVSVEVDSDANVKTIYKTDCYKNFTKDYLDFPHNTVVLINTKGNCYSTGNNGEFEVWGYFKKDKNGDYEKVNYTITAIDNEDRFIEKSVTRYIEDKPEDGVQIILKEKTISQAREDNLTGITGFKCNELMPKYLAGANCNDNKTLEGDATDLAYWIQKIGGKIAGAIAMIAVVLIVWNAFNMVTAAGDEDKISTAKKGLIWAIIGLALTMFAYVIVKTVIMLAYTQ